VGLTSTGKEESAAAATEWRELRAQVEFLDDECRTLRRKVLCNAAVVVVVVVVVVVIDNRNFLYENYFP